MDSNGNNPYQVNDGNNIKGLYAKFPSWSPDGRYISFHLCYGCPAVINYDVYIFDTQVKKLIRLTDTPGSNTHPAWSPDGYRLIYSSNRDYIFGDSARYRTDLYSINIDGTGEERRTWTGNVSNPEWGPDGRFVAFEWNSNFQSKVYIHDLIESITTRIEDPDLGKVANPRWSRKYSNLMVFGEIWDSLDSIIRLYEVEPNSRTTVQTIKMNDEGVNYDWIETQ
jgi:Tol biopolymer transport system component